MRILGIDPGYAIVGYGVLDFAAAKFTPVDYGAVTTPAHTQMERRLADIYEGVSEIISRHKPDCMAIEKLFFTNNQKTAIAVAQARGVVILAAALAGVEVFEYTPLQVKQAVVGYGRAEKSQVIEMTRVLLKLREAPKPDDTADALAIAICHGHSAGSQLMVYIKEKGL